MPMINEGDKNATRSIRNKIARLVQHIKRQPNDRVAMDALKKWRG